jgi:hypothetical protein
MARISVRIALALAAIGGAALAPLATQAAPLSGMRILHHEALQAVAEDASGRTLDFDAYGKRFALRLERNERMAFVSAARTPGVEALRGTVEGAAGAGSTVHGSWVRLTRTPAGLYGMFYDGRDLYAIEPARAAAAHVVGKLEAQGSAPVIYRLADTLVPVGQASCATVASPTATENSQTGLQQFQNLAAEIKVMAADQQALAATAPSRQLQVAVVGDNELTDLTFSDGSTPEEAIASRFNVVDGIFSSQIGVKILVSYVDVMRTPDSFTATKDAKTLLGELASFRQDTPAQYSRGLTHMLTGKELDGNTVGIAYVGGLCSRSSGVGLSQANLYWSDSALVIAHEIGHNFGALHDGDSDGSPACAATGETFLMAPALNGSRQFSQCSLDAIAPKVANASCLTPLSVPDADFDLPAPTRHLRAAAFSYAFNVRSIGAVAVDNVSVAVTLPTAFAGGTASVAGGGACTAAGNVLTCSVGSLAAQATRAITLNLAAPQSGSFVVSTALTSSNDAVAFNNSGQASFVIDPSADLSVTLAAAPASFVTGGTSQVTATVNHASGDAVTDATLSLTIPSGLTVSSVAANQLGCALVNAAVTCTGMPLTAGASRSVVLTVTASQAGNRQLGATVSAAVGDPATANNAAQVSIDTTAPAAASSGGGGGAFDAWILLALAGLVARGLLPRTALRRALAPRAVSGRAGPRAPSRPA